MKVLIAYDLSSDGARSRVAARLSAWGDRLQRSVFECQLQADELAEVLAEIEELINPSKDVVQVFRQCSSCDSERVDLGQAHELSDDPFWVI